MSDKKANLPAVQAQKLLTPNDFAEILADEKMEFPEKEEYFIYMLNQEPSEKWIKYHPTIKIDSGKKNERGEKIMIPYPYLPIQRIEWLLTRIFKFWRSKVVNQVHIANSVVTTVRVTVRNPLTGKWDLWHEGTGAQPIQTDKDKGAIDWNYIKSNGVQLAAPASESLAFKSAAEKFGRFLGKDLSRQDPIAFSIPDKDTITPEELKELLDQKREKLTEVQIKRYEDIIEKQETGSYKKTKKELEAIN